MIFRNRLIALGWGISLLQLGVSQELQSSSCSAESSSDDEVCLIQRMRSNIDKTPPAHPGQLSPDSDDLDLFPATDDDSDAGSDDDPAYDEYEYDEETVQRNERLLAQHLGRGASRDREKKGGCETPGVRMWHHREGVKHAAESLYRIYKDRIPQTMPDVTGSAGTFGWSLSNIEAKSSVDGFKVDFQEKHGVMVMTEGLKIKLKAHYVIETLQNNDVLSNGTALISASSNLASFGGMLYPNATDDGDLQLDVSPLVKVAFDSIKLDGTGHEEESKFKSVIDAMRTTTSRALDAALRDGAESLVKNVANPYLKGLNTMVPVELPEPIGSFLLKAPLCRTFLTSEHLAMDMGATATVKGSDLKYPMPTCAALREKPPTQLAKSHFVAEVTQDTVNAWLWMGHKLGRFRLAEIRLTAPLEQYLDGMSRRLGGGGEPITGKGDYHLSVRTCDPPVASFKHIHQGAVNGRFIIEVRKRIRSKIGHSDDNLTAQSRIFVAAKAPLSLRASVGISKAYPQRLGTQITHERLSPTKVLWSRQNYHSWFIEKLADLVVEDVIKPALKDFHRHHLNVNDIDKVNLMELFQVRHAHIIPKDGRLYGAADYHFVSPKDALHSE